MGLVGSTVKVMSMSVVAGLDNVNSWVDLIVGFGHFACGVATLWMTELRNKTSPP